MFFPQAFVPLEARRPPAKANLGRSPTVSWRILINLPSALWPTKRASVTNISIDEFSSGSRSDTEAVLAGSNGSRKSFPAFNPSEPSAGWTWLIPAVTQIRPILSMISRNSRPQPNTLSGPGDWMAAVLSPSLPGKFFPILRNAFQGTVCGALAKNHEYTASISVGFLVVPWVFYLCRRSAVTRSSFGATPPVVGEDLERRVQGL